MSKTNIPSKKALAGSVTAIILCFTMLLGSTFAWFTASSSTDMNTIQSGILDVDLVDAAGTSVVGRKLNFVPADGRTTILWEPGCTFNLEDIFVKNEGNLALKYKIAINEDTVIGDAKLLEVIDFTVEAEGQEVDINSYIGHLAAGETSAEPVVITGHMDEQAGNEYQNLSIEKIAVTVYATQDTVETDSIDNQYDAAATISTEAGDEARLLLALGAAADGNVILTKDVEISANLALNDGILDGNGQTLNKENTTYNPADGKVNAGVVPTGGIIKDITISGQDFEVGGKTYGFRAIYVTKGLSSNLHVEGATLEGTYAINIQDWEVPPASTGALIVKDSTINGWVSYAGGITGATFTDTDFVTTGSYAVFRPYVDTVMTGCSFTAGYSFGAGSNADLIIELNNCTVGGQALSAANFAELFTVEEALKSCSVIVDGVKVVF